MVKGYRERFGSMNEVWNEWIDPNNKPVRATTQASLATCIGGFEVKWCSV